MSYKHKDKSYMLQAFSIANMSKCVRAQYGAIIVSVDDAIIATGYNGKPRGAKNDHICYREGLPPNCREKPNCCLHVEVNTIMNSNRRDRLGGTMYLSGIPCKDCCLVLMNSGLSRVVYYAGETTHGHLGNGGIELFKEYGIENVELVPFTYEEFDKWEASQ